MEYRLYEVGGKLRDEALGLKSKDVDYSVELVGFEGSIEEAYKAFCKQITSEGFDIKIEHPESLTVRALFPKEHQYSGVADFVIARKELHYPAGSRRPVCVLGTLYDDLVRRDFTVNALARGEDGEVIDLFGGFRDLHLKVLRTPTEPAQSFKDDPLRIIRAMRFCITKGFTLSQDTKEAIQEFGILGLRKVSVERVKDELEKCFKHDTVATLNYLIYMRDVLKFDLISYSFEDTGLRLIPTNKK